METRTTDPDSLSIPQEAGLDEASELAVALERVRLLVQTSAVEEARTLAKEMEARWPEDEDVQYWARVLAPATVRVLKGVRGRPLDRERAWLQSARARIPGLLAGSQWQ